MTRLAWALVAACGIAIFGGLFAALGWIGRKIWSEL